jgi:hypothetical protein
MVGGFSWYIWSASLIDMMSRCSFLAMSAISASLAKKPLPMFHYLKKM